MKVVDCIGSPRERGLVHGRLTFLTYRHVPNYWKIHVV